MIELVPKKFHDGDWVRIIKTAVVGRVTTYRMIGDAEGNDQQILKVQPLNGGTPINVEARCCTEVAAPPNASDLAAAVAASPLPPHAPARTLADKDGLLPHGVIALARDIVTNKRRRCQMATDREIATLAIYIIEFSDALKGIALVDRTPAYAPGEAAPNGMQPPAKPGRFLTPKQIVASFLGEVK